MMFPMSKPGLRATLCAAVLCLLVISSEARPRRGPGSGRRRVSGLHEGRPHGSGGQYHREHKSTVCSTADVNGTVLYSDPCEFAIYDCVESTGRRARRGRHHESSDEEDDDLINSLCQLIPCDSDVDCPGSTCSIFNQCTASREQDLFAHACEIRDSTGALVNTRMCRPCHECNTERQPEEFELIAGESLFASFCEKRRRGGRGRPESSESSESSESPESSESSESSESAESTTDAFESVPFEP